MSIQVWTWILVGITFTLYIGIAIWSRAGSTKEFYVAGGGVSRQCADPSQKAKRGCGALHLFGDGGSEPSANDRDCRHAGRAGRDVAGGGAGCDWHRTEG